jgi:hypothetical protein
MSLRQESHRMPSQLNYDLLVTIGLFILFGCAVGAVVYWTFWGWR